VPPKSGKNSDGFQQFCQEKAFKKSMKKTLEKRVRIRAMKPKSLKIQGSFSNKATE
jgi:hypothetical protein